MSNITKQKLLRCFYRIIAVFAIYLLVLGPVLWLTRKGLLPEKTFHMIGFPIPSMIEINGIIMGYYDMEYLLFWDPLFLDQCPLKLVLLRRIPGVLAMYILLTGPMFWLRRIGILSQKWVNILNYPLFILCDRINLFKKLFTWYIKQWDDQPIRR